MSAHLVVVAAPHYVVTDAAGAFSFEPPPGKYKLKAWAEDTGEPSPRTSRSESGENSVNIHVPRGTSVIRRGQIRDSAWKGALASRLP